MFKPEREKNKWKNEPNSNNSGVVRNKYGTGVRSFLVNSGLDNAKIGYDIENKKVTYDGKPVITPNSVIEGTSYADEASLRELALDLHKSEGRDFVSATDYAAQKTGIENAVNIDNGYASVGDRSIKAMVSSDGNAYVLKEDMDDAIDAYIAGINYKSERDIYEDWRSDYGDKLNEAISQILDDEWEYSIEDDPAYKAYAEAFMREGEKAYADAFGNVIANTNGYNNSAAITAASQGLGYYMEKLSDRIPELMAQDFERFNKNREARMSAIGELLELSDSEFEKMYNANSDYLERIGKANTANYERKLKADDKELEKRLTNSQIFNNYIDSETKLTELEFLPERLSTENALGKIDYIYRPKQYESELSQDAIKQALSELELEYGRDIYEAEVEGLRRDNRLKALEEKYFLRK